MPDGPDPNDPINIRTTRQKVLIWGRANFASYAWREETDSWLTLVAEFFLQRTRAAQVEGFFIRFKQRFPTAKDLVEAGDEGIAWVTSNLGLHRRGPLLLAIAQKIVAEGFPEGMEALLEIKGIGPYSAAAWLSLHQGKRAVIIDANVVRWLSRMTGMPYNRDPRGLKWVQSLCERLTPKRVFRDYNYAVLDFTMNICAKKPRCVQCPLKNICTWEWKSACGNHRFES
ncbi:MAG: hypothetical protein QNK37_07490 [Acidobacteriota bacterium]|nr:hypothetical protein [Acidobacteriota bacterium]